MECLGYIMMCNIYYVILYIYIYIYQHLHVGVTNGSPYTTIRDLQTGHPDMKVQYHWFTSGCTGKSGTYKRSLQVHHLQDLGECFYEPGDMGAWVTSRRLPSTDWKLLETASTGPAPTPNVLHSTLRLVRYAVGSRHSVGT